MQKIRQKLFYKYDRHAKLKLPIDLYAIGYSYCASDYRIERKTLPKTKFIQLLWFTKGEAFVLQGGSFSHAKKNQVTIVPIDVEADFRTETSSCEFWCILIGGSVATDIINYLKLSTSRPINAGPCPDDKIKTLQENIQSIVPFHEYQNSVLVYDLLLHIKKTSLKQTVDPKDMDSHVKKALRLMNNNFADPNLDINELSGILKISRPTFLKLFKAETGTTPKEYLNAKRLQKMVQLLQNADYAIGEIALLTGFRDANYMSRFFRKKMKVNPSEFRKFQLGDK